MVPIPMLPAVKSGFERAEHPSDIARYPGSRSRDHSLFLRLRSGDLSSFRRDKEADIAQRNFIAEITVEIGDRKKNGLTRNWFVESPGDAPVAGSQSQNENTAARALSGESSPMDRAPATFPSNRLVRGRGSGVRSPRDICGSMFSKPRHRVVDVTKFQWQTRRPNKVSVLIEEAEQIEPTAKPCRKLTRHRQ